MFVQAIIAPAPREGVEPSLERWADEVRPGAIGWLGMTGGTTAQGQALALARFTSQQDAQRNSERPEQDVWWAKTAEALGASVAFHDCVDVATVLDGGSDAAGFVQVIEAHPAKQVTATELAGFRERLVEAYRPDVLGGYVACSQDGAVFEVFYFPTQREAREHEARELPEEARARIERMRERLGELRYHDLPRPLLL